MKANAQAGFQSGTYYQTQYQINDIPISQAWREYDYYGRCTGVYQWWQRAVWHSEMGGEYINVSNGGQWASQSYNGTYYWYEWVNYKRFMGYQFYL